MTERVAIIDLGSNSARLIVMHIYHNGAYNLVYNQKESVRMSEGMAATGELTADSMWRAISTLKTFAHMCELVKVDKILAVATAAVRNAKNGNEFIALVQQHTGIPLQAISGEVEAHLGYTGIINTIDVDDALLFDLGGGSTEITLIKDR
ncbi:MAG: ppx 2, partial [Sporomusa sp.]|nr:ppx 2 [Sporomusa sp.]